MTSVHETYQFGTKVRRECHGDADLFRVVVNTYPDKTEVFELILQGSVQRHISLILIWLSRLRGPMIGNRGVLTRFGLSTLADFWDVILKPSIFRETYTCTSDLEGHSSLIISNPHPPTSTVFYVTMPRLPSLPNGISRYGKPPFAFQWPSGGNSPVEASHIRSHQWLEVQTLTATPNTLHRITSMERHEEQNLEREELGP